MQKDKSLNAAIKRVKAAQGMKDGGAAKKLKEVPAGNKGKGLSKLPTEVRNKMGFMAKGGMVKKPKMTKKKSPLNETGKTLSDADVAKVEKLMKPKTDRQLMQFEKGGAVCRGMGRAYMGKPRKVKIRQDIDVVWC